MDHRMLPMEIYADRPSLLWQRNLEQTGHLTIRLPVVYFLRVVHRDQTSILHRYRDIAIWIFSRKIFQERRSVVVPLVGRSVGRQYYTDLIYSFSLR